ncbi:MAG: DUF222 domain-containing protein [Pseudoclavibacter sp.]
MLELEEASVHARQLAAMQDVRIAAETAYLMGLPEEVRERRGARGSIPDHVYDDVVAEICALRRIGRRQVEAELAEASQVIDHLPGLFDDMFDGTIGRRHVRAITDEAAPLVDAKHAAEGALERALRDRTTGPSEHERLRVTVDEADARLVEYEQQSIQLADGRTAATLRDRCRRLASRLLGQTAEQRKRAARAGRRVWIRDAGDGMSELGALLSADIAAGIYDRLTEQAAAIARSNRDDVNAAEHGSPEQGSTDQGSADQSSAEQSNTEHGVGCGDTASDAEVASADPRTFEQIRADVLADMLLTGEPSEMHATGRGIDATVAITVPALTLLGVDVEPATLDGSSPIPLDDAKRYAASAPSWMRIITDPVTGVARSVDTYRPTAAQRALVGARDITCRFPGCRRKARRCDIDHAKAWAEGGPTATENLECLCQRHHTLKHSTAWVVRHDPEHPGYLIWTAPSGLKHSSHAPPIGPIFTTTEASRLKDAVDCTREAQSTTDAATSEAVTIGEHEAGTEDEESEVVEAVEAPPF